MKIHKGVTALGLAIAASMSLFASPAMAEEISEDDTVVVNGREFGPEDGVTVTTEDIVLVPGAGDEVGKEWVDTPPPGTFVPYDTWGTSYAISREIAYLFYEGKAKAAANVYNGQRIIQVCIQYQRNGVGVADRRCSGATSTGSAWRAGAEVLSYASDSPELVAPPTVFRIWTTRIDPQIF
ncbi:hypothetical protein [Microbacterium oxydans]|uniref:hypothetical protein n=1 Tax=Microbacterium oxydans TaxID=82380 RepID=UPI000F8F8881|nr:hypothetical protein [Microbacterium oxydans]AZS46126.1 hypothetical protein CVS53_00793 [Microbacterium oxydans]